MSFLSRLGAAFRAVPFEREPNDACPLCGHPVVVEATTLRTSYGAMGLPRTREELIAACPEHGRPPFSDATVGHERLVQDAGGLTSWRRAQARTRNRVLLVYGAVLTLSIVGLTIYLSR
jgi:hypothetical protein